MFHHDKVWPQHRSRRPGSAVNRGDRLQERSLQQCRQQPLTVTCAPSLTWTLRPPGREHVQRQAHRIFSSGRPGQHRRRAARAEPGAAPEPPSAGSCSSAGWRSTAAAAGRDLSSDDPGLARTYSPLCGGAPAAGMDATACDPRRRVAKPPRRAVRRRRHPERRVHCRRATSSYLLLPDDNKQTRAPERIKKASET